MLKEIFFLVNSPAYYKMISVNFTNAEKTIFMNISFWDLNVIK